MSPPPAPIPFARRAQDLSDHAYLEQYRAQGPVAVDRNGILTTFSHRHMLQVADPRLTRQVELELVQLRGITSGPIHDYYANALLFSNDPRHALRRRPLARTFAHRLIDGLRPRLRTVARDLIRPHLHGEPIDFLHEIAGALPARVIALILGVPDAQVPRFRALIETAMRALALRAGDDWHALANDLKDLDNWVEDLLADRRAQPLDDVLTDYVAATADGALTPAEIRAQITSVILAGADTTRMALASTLAQLLENPAQWAALTADPDGLKAAAAAEGLRFDPPVGSFPRVAVAAFDLDGVPVAPGQVIAASIIAALRDPDVYANPGNFDIFRTDHPRWHPVFGAGAHRCLGEALARAELEEALAALAALAPATRLIGPPPRLRGLTGARAIDGLQAALA